jgi:hypothetical protein
VVEHDLAKVGVASSSLVSRSSFSAALVASAPGLFGLKRQWRAIPQAGWQSGHAAACKAVYAGSIPTPASISRNIDGLAYCALRTRVCAVGGDAESALVVLRVRP